MELTSIYYLVFFMLAFFIYWALPGKFRWFFLLICSMAAYFFVVASYTFLYVIFSVGTVYLAARYISERERGRSIVFWLTVLVNVGLLVFFKYQSLITRTIYYFGGREKFETVETPIAPLAISFYLLQLLGYLIDCYLKEKGGGIAAEKNPFKLLLFAIYFPLMTSGPISRYKQLSDQLFKEKRFCPEMASDGLRRIAYGILKKRCVADVLEEPVRVVMGQYNIYHGFLIWFAVILYSIQLYFDFSGCMDIVIGTSQCLGIRLMENFKAPYLAVSVSDFWRRWHIALSSWLKDYIYIPLGGSRKGKFIKWRNYLITFAVSGLWHGGAYHYLFWGTLHGCYQILGDIKNNILYNCIGRFRQLWNGKCFVHIKRLWTFCLVAFAWLFFRATSIQDALCMIKFSFDVTDFKRLMFELGTEINLSTHFLLYLGAILTILFVFIMDALSEKGVDVKAYFSRQPFILRMIEYWCVVIVIIYLLCDTSPTASFIYNSF